MLTNIARTCFVFSMVSSYLVHHGYCATATAFARATETKIQEDQTSIKNRQSKLLQHSRVKVFQNTHAGASLLRNQSFTALANGQTRVVEHLCCLTGIQKLVLAGRVGEAIQVTQQLYPGLLEHNPNLLFVLKLVDAISLWSCPERKRRSPEVNGVSASPLSRCRQFVEMVNGTDGEVCGLNVHSPKSQDCYPAILSPHHGAANTHSHSAGTGRLCF